MIVLTQPKIEIAVRIESIDRLSEKAFQTTQKFVHFRQFLAGVSKEVLYIESWVPLPHEHGKRCAISPAGYPEHMSFNYTHSAVSSCQLLAAKTYSVAATCPNLP